MPVVGDIYGIEARVREIDPRLVVSFDYFKERYVIYERVHKQRVEAVTADGTQVHAFVDELMHVLTVTDDDGGFRPLDQRVLIQLHQMDTHANERLFEQTREKARKQREAHKRDRDDHIHQVTKYYYPLVRKELRYGL